MGRYVIFGAGAIGGVIGARLHASGQNVVLIARGKHARAIAARGLRVEHAGGSDVYKIPSVEHPAEAEVTGDDTVILAMKSQDTEGALVALSTCCGPDVPVICAQNGVDNERSALRRFSHVYGCLVVMPAAHLRPGVVSHAFQPVIGVLDLGLATGGRDERAEHVAAALRAASFSSEARDDIMSWKRRKLLSNLNNAADALFDDSAETSRYVERAREEGRACLAAAHLDVVAMSTYEQRLAVFREQPIETRLRSRSSSWQSLARASGSIEADYLNGEIVLLGRLHGIATPVNAALQRLANEQAARRSSPGSLPLSALEVLLTS